MLFYGDLKNAELIGDDPRYKIYNFSGFAEKYEKLQLIPPNDLGATNEYEYDVKYYHWIMDIDTNFTKMFQVVLQLINGVSVYLLTTDEYWSDSLIESFLKLLQQRYGLVGTCISSNDGNPYSMMDDILYASECKLDPVYGIRNFDEDNLRYQYIVSNNMLKVDPGIIRRLEAEI